MTVICLAIYFGFSRQLFLSQVQDCQQTMASCVLTPKVGWSRLVPSQQTDMHNHIFLWYCFKDYFKIVLCVRVLPVLMYYSGACVWGALQTVVSCHVVTEPARPLHAILTER